MKAYKLFVMGAVVLAVMLLAHAGSVAAPPQVRLDPWPYPVNCSPVTEVPAGECQALVALYYSTLGAGWYNHSGWLRTFTPCSWYGVSCAEGHIVRLALSRNGLRGYIPGQLGYLGYLSELELGGNALTGGIPPQIGRLTRLERLGLECNQLSGNIPPELGDLTHLQELYLYSNRLDGRLPPQLTHLTDLREFQY